MRVATPLLISLCSCAGLIRAHSSPEASHEMNLLRSQGGACADAYVQDSVLVKSTNLRGCARIGAPFTTADDDAPLLITHLSGPSFPDVDPSSWLVILTGPDGKELIRQTGPSGIGEVGNCDEYGCEKWNVFLLTLPSPWKPGTYHVRYICAFDTRRVADLSLTLTGSITVGLPLHRGPARTGPSPFVAPHAPTNPWEASATESYESNCRQALAAKYGTTRTPQQIEYSCDCIYWNLQDRHSHAELYQLSKTDNARFASEMQEVSAACKRSRPASLGPDPG